MQLKDIRLLFEHGALKEAIISPVFDDWSIEFTRKELAENITIETQKGQQRVFKTLNAAYAAIREVGFRNARIIDERSS